MARLAIARSFLADYARLDKDVRSAVDAAVATLARHPDPGLYVDKPPRSWDDRIRTFDVDGRWRGIALAPTIGDTYCLVTVLPQDKADAYATTRRFSVNPAPCQVTFVSGYEELRLVLSRPFAHWRTFLHPSQRKIAYRAGCSGPVQVTGGPGTGKTVTLLHRAAFLAAQAGDGQVLVTAFSGILADSLAAQLDPLIPNEGARRRIEVLNVDRLAYAVVRASRGAPVIADERMLRALWADAAARARLDLTPAFMKNEWEQVILAQDLSSEQTYLTCLRAGRGRPLGKAQRGQVWQAAQRVTGELAASRQSTHLQLANEAAHLLRREETPRYRHVLVDDAQDLHPSQWRLLRAAAAPGPDDLFITGDPHQRVYNNRVSLASLGISVRGRSHRLSLSYRTTQEILAWSVPLLGAEPVTGMDDEVDSLAGYRSPMHGPAPRLRMAAARAEELGWLAEQVRSWLVLGIEPQVIGVTARSAELVREAREFLAADGIMTSPLSGRGGGGGNGGQAVRAGTMHAMKGLEFQAVAVIGVERGLVPDPAAVTAEDEDPVGYAQDMQRERCTLFVACTRARDHLAVSGAGEPSPFLPATLADAGRAGPPASRGNCHSLPRHRRPGRAVAAPGLLLGVQRRLDVEPGNRSGDDDERRLYFSWQDSANQFHIEEVDSSELPPRRPAPPAPSTTCPPPAGRRR